MGTKGVKVDKNCGIIFEEMPALPNKEDSYPAAWFQDQTFLHLKSDAKG